MGITAFCCVKPAAVSPDADALFAKAHKVYGKAREDAKENPGLAEMYKIQAERLDPEKGSPGSEFIVVPGMLPSPSALCHFTLMGWEFLI